MGKSVTRESRLFYTVFLLEDRMPDDHPLRAVDAAVDFAFVRREASHFYVSNGHESADPALLLKFMFLLYFEDVRFERELTLVIRGAADWDCESMVGEGNAVDSRFVGDCRSNRGRGIYG